MTEEPESSALPLLLTLGHPRLALPSAPVPVEQVRSDGFQERLELLGQAMEEYEGIGIAAPQVGWFERFFLMAETRPAAENADDDAAEDANDAEDDNGYELHCWINPEIVSVSAEFAWAWEGCLSVPGLRGWIRRPAAVAVRALNARGEAVSREFTGWSARVFQHEFDHLEGLLFPYRAQDPRHVVTTDELARRESWPPDWPAPGARDAPLGDVLPEAP